MGAFTQEEASDMAQSILQMVETISDLQEALRPFAKEASEYEGWHSPSVIIRVTDDGNNQPRETWYSIADLRRATSVLERIAERERINRETEEVD